GYDQTLSSYYQNPLSGRLAWTGSSGGFVTTLVALPVAAAGQTVRLRWRLGSGSGTGADGWHVDSIHLTRPGFTCCSVPLRIVGPRVPAPQDIAFSYESISGKTYIVESVTNLAATNWSALQTNFGSGSLLSFTNSTTNA